MKKNKDFFLVIFFAVFYFVSLISYFWLLMTESIYFWTKHLNIYFMLLESLEKEVIFLFVN